METFPSHYFWRICVNKPGVLRCAFISTLLSSIDPLAWATML
jgi:hypothetical protein